MVNEELGKRKMDATEFGRSFRLSAPKFSIRSSIFTIHPSAQQASRFEQAREALRPRAF